LLNAEHENVMTQVLNFKRIDILLFKNSRM